MVSHNLKDYPVCLNAEGEISFEMEKFFLSHLAQKACKSSVRRNDILADEEIDVLIDAVNKSDFISCPHGRPFFFVMTKNEFEKKVQRR